MPSIDERVVSMAFENAKFEAGVAVTMQTLARLSDSLQKIGKANSFADIEKAAAKVSLEQPMSALDKLKTRLFGAGQGAAEGLGDIEKAGNKVTLNGPIAALDKVQAKTAQVGTHAADGFNEIERASNRVSLSGLVSALDSVTSRFSILQGAASVALGTIAAQATTRGASVAKSFSFGPLTQGFEEYQTNLKSIQTILANTEGQRVSGLDATNKALEELNRYSDQTIYNFSEMAKNIGTFTAAGVDLPKATASIKGIANLAALSGSSSQQASTAMYQLSQAIAAGRVSLQDWNSVVNAGMGGAKFQQALMRTAENFGALEKGAVKIDKATGKATVNGQSFRESIMAKPGEQSWLTSDVLTETLKQFTGDMTAAELAAQGFSEEQIKAIMATAKTAKAAATEVKTLPQVFDVAREAIGSGWSKTFQFIFGDFNQAKKTFTELSNTINGFINRMSDARNEILKGWSELGGRKELIEGIKNIFEALFAVLKPIGQAFRDIFPPQTAQSLFEMTKNFRDFTENLKPGEAVIDGIKRTFRGLFAVLHIGWEVVKGVIGVISNLLGVVGQGSGGFFNLTGSIGDFLVALDTALTKGGLLTSFFETISSVLQAPMELFATLAKLIFGIFGGVDSAKASAFGDSLDKVGKAATPLTPILQSLKGAWDGLVQIFEDAQSLVSPWLDQIAEQLSHLGTVISNAFQNIDSGQFLSVLQTGFIAGIFLVLKKAITGGGKELTNALGGLNNVFGALTGNLEAMQQNVKATVILKIAAAIGILAAGVYVLSTIDPKRLASALTAMAVGMSELMVAVKLMTSGVGLTAILTLPVLAAGLIGVATAATVLAGAVKIFSTMSWEEIAKGLAGVAGGLTAIGVGMRLLGPGTIVQAPAILALAVALNILALAVKQFASIKWEDLGRGLAGLMGSLIAIVAPLNAMGPTLILVGPGLVAASFGITMLAGAVAAFGAMKPETLVKGMIGIAGALVALGVSISTIPPTVALQAAGLVILSVALMGIAGAIGTMGSLKIETIVKGLAALGGALAILAVGLGAMSGTMAGSVALLAAAGALALLAPTLGFLGTLNWGTIFKGLGAMALVLGTLSIVGTVASAGLVSLGVSLLPLAGVFVLTAGAVFIFAKALALLGDNGAKGIGVMVAAITAFLALLPNLVINFVKGLVDVLAAVASVAPKVVDSLAKILQTVIQFIIAQAPQFAVAIGILVDSILAVIVTNAPKIIAAGFKLLLDFLSGIEQNIAQVVSKAASVVVKFLDGISSKAGDLSASGANLLVKFLDGISAQFPKLVSAAVNTVLKFIGAVAGQLPKVLTAGVELIARFITGIFSRVGKVIDAGVRVVLNIVTGIGNSLPRIVKAAGEVVKKFINAVANVGPDIVDAGFKALVKFLNGIAKAIRENDKDLAEAGANIAQAIVEGLVEGLGVLARRVLKPVVEKLFDALPGWARKVLGIHSPSTVFVEIGQHIGDGLALGLEGIGPMLRERVTNPIRAMLEENKTVGEFGRFIGSEFKNGLNGGLWDADGRSASRKTIEGAFSDLSTKLKEEQGKLREAIKVDQEQLRQELEKDPQNQDPTMIAQLSANIAANRNLLNQATAATSALIKNLRSTKSELVALGNEYATVSQKLQEAQAALEEATRARDEAMRTYQSQFSQTPDISNLVSTKLSDLQLTEQERIDKAKKASEEAEKLRQINQVALYQQAIQAQIAATEKFKTTLQSLRDLGLDDATYKKLLEQGTKAQDFADQLLASGKEGVDEINKLDAELLKQSTELAKNAATNLYQAGVDAAAGLVKGLKNKQSEIRAAMEDIAEDMIGAIRKKLKIKSPSQVFMEVGKFSAQGMVRGFQNSSGDVASAAEGVGNSAVTAIQNSMKRAGSAFAMEIDPNPKITPVLDLSNIRKGAKEIRGLSGISSATAFGMATAISSERQSTIEESSDSVTPMASFRFEQNNYSPEALSPAEIYRQTQNQLSQVKGALGFSVSK